MKKTTALNSVVKSFLCATLVCCMVGGSDAASTKASAISKSSVTKTGGVKTDADRMLTVPTPKASKGTYTGYVKVSWSKVSRASGYYIFRGTSTSWSKAKRIKTISTGSTVSYKDTSASSSGKKYYYWVCPFDTAHYYYNTGRYAKGYRKAKSTAKASISFSSSKVKAGTRVLIYYKKGSTYKKPSSITYSVSASGVARAYHYTKLTNKACGYIDTFKAGTVTIKIGSLSKKLTVTGSSTTSSSNFYIANYSGKKLTSLSLGLGQTETLTLRNSSGKTIGATWLKSNGNISTTSASVSGLVFNYGIRGTLPGSTVVSAIYNGNTYKITVTIGGGGGSKSSYSITGASSIPYGSTKKYELNKGGKKQTNVTWKFNSGLRKVVVSAGTLSVTPTSRPVSTTTSAVHAYVNGKKVASKTVKITR